MDNSIKKSNIIHVVLAADGNYSMQCRVTIASILFNNDKSDFYEFHILDGGIGNNKNKFKFKGFTNYNITFYDMSVFDVSKFSIMLEHTTVSTYYRLFLTEILPRDIDKILYLDCDLIVVKDIKILWDTDITKYWAAVVEDNLLGDFDYLKAVINDNFCYFNAGVILFNLKKLRENNFLEKCLNFYSSHENKLCYQDQDVLNYVLAGKCLYLSVNWNMQTAFFVYNHTKTLDEKAFNLYRENSYIIHYTEPYKPWCISYLHPIKDLYQKYMLMISSPYEKLLYYLKISLFLIFSNQIFFNYRIIKLFNLPIYELNGYKRKVIKLFNIPIYYKFRVKNKFREYLCNLRIK